jgi:hypothetical protein
VPHARREAMTLGQYIERHGYITQGSGSERKEDYIADILKRKIEQVLGQAVDINEANYIDWEVAGVRTNPGMHQAEDARIRSSLAEGKGYNQEGSSDNILESHLSGRAAADIGESPLIAQINETTG